MYVEIAELDELKPSSERAISPRIQSKVSGTDQFFFKLLVQAFGLGHLGFVNQTGQYLNNIKVNGF